MHCYLCVASLGPKHCSLGHTTSQPCIRLSENEMFLGKRPGRHAIRPSNNRINGLILTYKLVKYINLQPGLLLTCQEQAVGSTPLSSTKPHPAKRCVLPVIFFFFLQCTLQLWNHTKITLTAAWNHTEFFRCRVRSVQQAAASHVNQTGSAVYQTGQSEE